MRIFYIVTSISICVAALMLAFTYKQQGASKFDLEKIKVRLQEKELSIGMNSVIVGDINNDSLVDRNDLSLLVTYLYQTEALDLTKDGKVDMQDFDSLYSTIYNR